MVIATLQISCAGLPDNIEPVDNFDLDRYIGKWYEIARLDHRFERGLSQVTATYSIKEDGSVRVFNKGFKQKTEKWEEAVGKARFVGDSNIGHLEVSFFGPFYGNYAVFELDHENYQYAFITGSENTLWLLSRTPTVSDQLQQRFLNAAKKLGYNLDELIIVDQALNL